MKILKLAKIYRKYNICVSDVHKIVFYNRDITIEDVLLNRYNFLITYNFNIFNGIDSQNRFK